MIKYVYIPQKVFIAPLLPSNSNARGAVKEKRISYAAALLFTFNGSFVISNIYFFKRWTDGKYERRDF